MKVDLQSLFKHVPAVLHSQIRASPHCTAKSETIVISSDESRKQSDNVHHCHSKLHQIIVDAGRTSIPGETSEAQQRRVQGL